MTDYYTFFVTCSVDDDEYVGLCAEFPSLSWLAPTSEEAFFGIRQVVADCTADMEAANETAPRPIADRTSREAYGTSAAGNPPPRLARAEEDVSLNQLIRRDWHGVGR